MRQFLFLLLIFWSLFESTGNAQIIEDFSDGNFNNNPQWFGDTARFRVNDSLMLQSNGIAASDEIYLSLKNSKYENSIWEFKIIQAFATSSGNHALFYLASDSLNLLNATKAYYLKIGGESGNDDSIDLYYVENGNKQKLIDGLDGFCGADSNVNSIRLEKTHEGLWSLYADSGNHNLIFQGSVYSEESFHSLASGLVFKHSSSRRDKLYFDDLRIQNADFRFISQSQLESDKLRLSFSNPLDTSLILPQNFNLLTGTPSVQSIDIESRNIELQLSDHLAPGNYQLEILSLLDDEGQEMNDTIISFRVFKNAEFEEIIFNEIMFDPEPSIGLPIHEYVELFNVSNTDLQLGGMIYSDQDNEVVLPEYIFEKDAYLILCDLEDTSEYKQYGDVLGLENWLSLNNSGDIISLRRGNELIDAFEFNSASHSDQSKSNGGWSIERIDPVKKCDKYENWSSSLDQIGGTPGNINSVYQDFIDSVGPQISDLKLRDEKSIDIVFNESLNFSSTQNLVYDINWATDLIPNSLIADTLKLISTIALEKGRSYDLKIDSIQDCEENWSWNLSSDFHFGGSPEEFELVINEIYADPGENESLPDSEYLEFKNASDRVINCAGISIVDNKDTIPLPDLDLTPGELFIICPESKMEDFSNQINIHALDKWPSLSNSGEKLQLIEEGRLIHFVEYDKILEIIDLDSKGLSIEMMNSQNPCDIYNWALSQNEKGGTPGFENSIHSEKIDQSPPKIDKWHFSSDSSISIQMSEYVNEDVADNSNFQIQPALGKVLPRIDWIWNEEIEISFEGKFEHDIHYELKINQSKDCLDNYSVNEGVELFIARPAGQADLILNEILFEAHSGESEFLEIINQSGDQINLKNCQLQLIDMQDTSLNKYTISQIDLILEPNEYYVICEDSVSINKTYPWHGKRHFIEMENFPSLPNDGRQISILDSSGLTIDKMIYSDDLHFYLLEKSKGVSLERISMNKSAMEDDNWNSASENSGYATPGYRNSHQMGIFDKDDFVISPKIFSPDGDGFQDQIGFNINTQNTAYSASLKIFDMNGNFIHSLAENSNLGSRNTFFWDGILIDGQKIKAGIYLAVLDLISTQGKSERLKKTFSVGLKL